MPILIIPPPNTKSPNLYEAYNYIMSGDLARCRQTMAQFYNEGKNNPRAQLYETMIERRKIRDFGYKSLKFAEPEQRYLLRKEHIAAMNEIFFSDHQMVKNAFDRLQDNFNKMYPNKKTQRLTRFVLGKTAFPLMENFKCIIKFMK